MEFFTYQVSLNKPGGSKFEGKVWIWTYWVVDVYLTSRWRYGVGSWMCACGAGGGSGCSRNLISMWTARIWKLETGESVRGDRTPLQVLVHWGLASKGDWGKADSEEGREPGKWGSRNWTTLLDGTERSGKMKTKNWPLDWLQEGHWYPWQKLFWCSHGKFCLKTGRVYIFFVNHILPVIPV